MQLRGMRHVVGKHSHASIEVARDHGDYFVLWLAPLMFVPTTEFPRSDFSRGSADVKSD